MIQDRRPDDPVIDLTIKIKLAHIRGMLVLAFGICFGMLAGRALFRTSDLFPVFLIMLVAIFGYIACRVKESEMLKRRFNG